MIGAIGLTGFPATFVAFFLTKILGVGLDHGLIVLDISLDKLGEARKDPKWRAAADKAYAHATEKVHTEEEKIEIRNEYMAALAAYATYGNGVPVDKNT